ncbi:P-loop containing nucleoside triphosphate hydrolase protein [Rhizoctonia solani]|uniref:P-loop containing nucleoside triphosphate hydrolase protein n=1 Tax=Rhizoctonia solani TaxID=456999 RepID=A0A8H7H1Y2_9AGAM|nr:P-loop containing nucleoside triphosphate hydrolase protein [Rhizoctonia solani]
MPGNANSSTSVKDEQIATGSNVNKKKAPDHSYTFREKKLGVWTLYYPWTSEWTPTPMKFGIQNNLKQITAITAVWYRFFTEVFALGPAVMCLYFVSLVSSSILPSVQLSNDTSLLNLAEAALVGRIERTAVIVEFRKLGVRYISTLVMVLATSALKEYSGSIIEQRVTLHFEQQILAIQSRLELGASQDPNVKSHLKTAEGYISRPWITLSGLVDMLLSIGEVLALSTTFKGEFMSSESAGSLGIFSVLCPLLWGLHGLVNTKGNVGFAKVTDPNWRQMRAMRWIGTNEVYKQEVLSSGLVEYINNQYARALSKLGDTSTKDPWAAERAGWSRLDRLNQTLDSLPLLFYAWSISHSPSGFSLSHMVRMQQTTRVMRMVIATMISRLKSISALSNNLVILYELLALGPGITDGFISYPDEAHARQKGMATEFKDVSFGYPSALKKTLNKLSFKVEPGQLCVIVGENGCGKSTTISLINRLYDCESGEIYIDGLPIRDYKISTLRAATNIMHQSYSYFPLTIRENLTMKDTGDPTTQTKRIENATKLGGAYDFIQKLPLKFETNFIPIHIGISSPGTRAVDREQFKCLMETEKHSNLSGGQWQRLELSRSFMKNSERTRLLCYDEPSASLDPKAEAGDGSTIEQGTHKTLLTQKGEYAKMYEIQSRAFVESEMEDALNVLVAIAAIYFAYRWLSRDNGGAGTGGNARPATVLGFTPKNVTPEMIASVRSAFPQESIDNIRYDLLKSGSVEITSNKILERGYLDRPPPAYFTLYPPTPAADVTTTDTPSPTSTNDTSVKNTSLLSRYGLEARANEGSATEFSDKAAWEDSASKREASLKERKAQMILAARQRMLAQQSQSSSS